MKIIGEQCLNKNNYDSIIMNLSTSKFKVDVIGNENLLTEHSVDSFVSSINNLNDSVKTIKIINYFFRNNMICEINNFDSIQNYSGCYTTVKSVGNRMLAIKFGDNDTYKPICSAIINKYYSDRYKYCYENDIKEISCSNDCIKYKDKLVLRLEYDKCDILAKSEERFLEELILDKLDYINKAYIVKESKIEKNGFKHTVSYLINGNTKIQINTLVIINIVNKIISKYNKELVKREEKQLKIGGFFEDRR